MTWTPERIAELTFIARDVYTESPVIEELCDALEAQQAELEAARGMATILDSIFLGKINLPTDVPGTETVSLQMDAAVIHGLRWALERYDAARAGQGTL